MLEKIAHNPYLNLLCGLVLLVTSGYETWQTIDHFTLGAHHGVLLFGLIQILKALPDIMDGAEKLAGAKAGV